MGAERRWGWLAGGGARLRLAVTAGKRPRLRAPQSAWPVSPPQPTPLTPPLPTPLPPSVSRALLCLAFFGRCDAGGC